MSAGELFLLLIAVVLAATAQVLLKSGMSVLGAAHRDSRSELLLRAATSPAVLGGLALFGLSAVAWMVTLSRIPLNVAYPFNALGYLLIVALSVFMLGERANLWTWVGTAIVIAGLLVVVLNRP